MWGGGWGWWENNNPSNMGLQLSRIRLGRFPASLPLPSQAHHNFSCLITTGTGRRHAHLAYGPWHEVCSKFQHYKFTQRVLKKRRLSFSAPHATFSYHTQESWRECLAWHVVIEHTRDYSSLQLQAVQSALPIHEFMQCSMKEQREAKRKGAQQE